MFCAFTRYVQFGCATPTQKKGIWCVGGDDLFFMNVLVYLVLLSAGTFGAWKYWEQYESVIWISHWQECSAKWFVNQELISGVSPGSSSSSSVNVNSNADMPWFAQQIRDTVKVAICDSGENEVRYKDKIDCERVREELRLGVGYCVLNKRLGSHSLTAFAFHLWNSWVTWISAMVLAYFMIYGFWRMQTKKAKTTATAEVYMRMLTHQQQQQWHPHHHQQQPRRHGHPASTVANKALEYHNVNADMIVPLHQERPSAPASSKYRMPASYVPPPQSAPMMYGGGRPFGGANRHLPPPSYASPPP